MNIEAVAHIHSAYTYAVRDLDGLTIHHLSQLQPSELEVAVNAAVRLIAFAETIAATQTAGVR